MVAHAVMGEGKLLVIIIICDAGAADGFSKVDGAGGNQDDKNFKCALPLEGDIQRQVHGEVLIRFFSELSLHFPTLLPC